jgi:multidrug resistance efflux pump
VTVAVLGLVAAVAGSTAVAVHHLDQTELKRIQDKAAMDIAQAKADVARDQTEIKRIQDKAATEIKRIHDKAATDIAQAKADVARVEGERKSEVARVEGERRLSEERLRAEVERYKYDLRLTQTQDFEPYEAAIRENQIKRGGAGGPQD